MSARPSHSFLQTGAALALLGLAADLHAETLVNYLPDQSGAPISDTDPIGPATVFTDLNPGDLFQNAPNGLQNTFVWPVDVSSALTATEYMSFTLTPVNGRVLAFRRLDYSGRSYFDSNLTLHLRSSIDGFFSTIDSGTTSGAGGRDFDLSFDLNVLPDGIDTAVEFRLYPGNNGGTDDFMDLRGDTGVGVTLSGGLARRHDFIDAQFYSFSLDQVGGFEISAPDRHIRFLALDLDTMRLQNQFSGDARALCLTGHKDFFSASVFDPAEVTAQFPDCLDIASSDQPSDVSIWKLPDGRLFRFQVLEFTITELGGGDIFAVEGTVQAGPLLPLLIFRGDFE